ncbi:hypothetical protein D3C86_1977270 [compost metagenome]
MLGIEHRHDHHRAVPGALADQAFIRALHAVGKAQLHLFHAEQSTGGDNFAGEYGGFLAHAKLLGVNALL